MPSYRPYTGMLKSTCNFASSHFIDCLICVTGWRVGENESTFCCSSVDQNKTNTGTSQHRRVCRCNTSSMPYSLHPFMGDKSEEGESMEGEGRAGEYD